MRTLFNTSFRTLLLCLVVLITGSSGPPLASGQSSRTITVHFEVESELYRSQLAEYIETLEQDLSTSVAELLNDKPALGYRKWVPANAETIEDDTSEQHHLHLILEEKSSPLGAEMHIRFVTHIAGAPRNDLSNQSIEAFYPTVFRAIDSKFAQDYVRLEQEITTWLRETHFDQTFEDELTRHFLRYVPLISIDPLSADMKIDPALIIIATPISYSDLYPDEQSKLKAIFHSAYAQDPASNLTGEILPGHMYLRPIVDAGTRLRVSFTCHNAADSLCFSYPGTSILSEAEITQNFTRIQSILDRDNLVDMRLYMEKYVKNYYPVTTGGIVNTP